LIDLIVPSYDGLLREVRLKEGVDLLEFGYGSLEELVKGLFGATNDGSIIRFVEVFDKDIINFWFGWYFLLTILNLILDIKEV
jgi:hypothetical protein